MVMHLHPIGSKKHPIGSVRTPYDTKVTKNVREITSSTCLFHSMDRFCYELSARTTYWYLSVNKLAIKSGLMA